MIASSLTAAQLQRGDSGSTGMSQTQLDHAASLLRTEVSEGRMRSASILVARDGKIVLHEGFGRLSSQPQAPAVGPDTIYQVASITKPVTAVALMMLVERGKLSLSDPVSLHLPEFKGEDRASMRVLDLLAHTSGLPDMLPENTELRRANAPLKEFVRRAMTTPLSFKPGSGFQYQSMGTLLAAEIVERIAGMPLPEFERKEIFGPLGMKRSVLGLEPLRISETVLIEEASTADPKDLARFGANTEYWRKMAHPWGGLHTNTTELAILLQTFLNGGTYAGHRLLSPATARAMVTDQNTRLGKPWGLGWGLARSTVWSKFGDLISPDTFGHSGASGTVAWADPHSKVICVILTGRPSAWDDGRFLRRVSNAVAAAVQK